MRCRAGSNEKSAKWRVLGEAWGFEFEKEKSFLGRTCNPPLFEPPPSFLAFVVKFTRADSALLSNAEGGVHVHLLLH